MEKSDAELMREVQAGADEAFRALVERHRGGLLNFFFRMTWDRNLAEDYSQEVFCRVFVHRESYRPKASFATYLYRIARNYWIDQQRMKKNHPAEVSLDQPLSEARGTGRVLTDVLENPGAGEREMGGNEIVERLQAALGSLPEDQRTVFVLSENRGMKYQEIAEVLAIPVGTVKSRMHNAVKRLRESLAEALAKEN